MTSRVGTRWARQVPAVLIIGLSSSLLLAQSGSAPAPAAVDSIQGMLSDGSNYRAVKPERWNGTLVLDLDFANRLDAPPSAIERWMTANGFAISGISREPVAYRFSQAVEDLVAVRAKFTEKWRGAPRRTLSLGNSRGGFVSRLAMELHPEIFDGAVLSAGGGAGEIGTFNSKLDALWTLKTLTGAPLQLVGFASQADAMAENARLTTLVTELRATPAGRARLAMAAAFEQFPTWTRGDAPPAAADWEAQLDQIAEGFVFGNPAQVRHGLELIAGGNFSWNHGVDYAAMLARSGMSPLVEALYMKAGTSLQADLQTLTRAPRIGATAVAVATAERITSYTGKISGPVIVVDNIGDPVDADAFKRAYEQTVTRADKSALLRTTWVRSAGHASQSALERITGFVALIERLDTGAWGDTSPEAMNARAARIAATSSFDLGPSRFITHTPPDMLRPWDGSKWGSYAPPRESARSVR
jgi:pimeloyl-ACP methyl ester carboxylesterase